MAYPRPLELFAGSPQCLRTYPGSGSGAITKLLSSCDFFSRHRTVHMTLHACLAPAGLWGPGLSASAPGTTSLVMFNAFTTSSFSFQTKQSAKFLVFFFLQFLFCGAPVSRTRRHPDSYRQMASWTLVSARNEQFRCCAFVRTCLARSILPYS